MSGISLTSLALTVLALPNLREELRKVWRLPAALGAAIITFSTIKEVFGGYSNGNP